MTKKGTAKPKVAKVAIPLCGALTRGKDTKSPTCRRPAGWGTANGHQGPCKLHGGASLVRHGRYSKIMRPRLAELIAEHEADPDPLNIIPELAAARALFVDFIERYDEWREAILAWHASWDTYRKPIPEEMAMGFAAAIDEYEQLLRAEAEPTERQLDDLDGARKLVKYLRGEDVPTRPRHILDVSAAIQHINVISQVVKREQDSRADSAVSRKDLWRVQEMMAKAVFDHVVRAIPDEELRLSVLKGIQSDWGEIRV